MGAGWGGVVEEKLREPEMKKDLGLHSNLPVNLSFIVKLGECRREAPLLSFICKSQQDSLASIRDVPHHGCAFI